MPSLRCHSCLVALCATGLFPARAADESASALQPSLTVTAELWQNTRGGAQTGGWWNTLAEFGLEFDLARLGGPAGSKLVAQTHWVENRTDHRCFAETTGTYNASSGLMAGDHTRLFNLYYRQSWRGGAVALKLGQLALDDDFMGSDYAGLFVNSAFGAMPSQVGTTLCSHCNNNSGYPIYGVASPGVWLGVRPTRPVLWQTGIYYGGPGPDNRHNHGFDWQGLSHSGVVVFTEAAGSCTVGGHEATLRLGAAYHSGHFDNYAALVSGCTATTARGLHSLYAVHDLVLVARADQPRLAAFVRAGLSPQRDRSAATVYTDAGLNWFAPCVRRPEDTAGLAVSHTHFGPAFRTVSGAAATETTLELTYQAKIGPHLSVQADAQFVFSPAFAAAAGARRTAVILGLRSALCF